MVSDFIFTSLWYWGNIHDIAGVVGNGDTSASSVELPNVQVCTSLPQGKLVRNDDSSTSAAKIQTLILPQLSVEFQHLQL